MPKFATVMGAACLMLLLAVIPTEGGDLSNRYCPVITNEPAEEQFAVNYQGQQVYFCCNKCKKEFLANPEAYLANLESSAWDSSASVSSHAHDEGAHEHAEGTATVTADGHEQNSTLSHDHKTDHGESSQLIGIAGKFHPMLTHFPIALILSALLFSVLAALLPIQTMDYVSVYSIYLAAITGIGTVILGLAAGSSASYPSFLMEYLSWHRLLGLSTGVVTLLTAHLGKRLLQRSSTQAAWTYRTSLLVNAILVGVTGHFGATLVFGPDHFNF